MSKETPIDYSTPMVQSVLDGRKKMTRRTCKHQNWSYSELIDVNVEGITQKIDRSVSCPYGQVGDLLWVREEHKLTFEGNYWIIEYKDGTIVRKYYKQLSINLLERLCARKTLGKWQRARFLPKELSRIWLKVTSIKVERLQSITPEDAINEGLLALGNSKTLFLYYDDYAMSVIAGGEMKKQVICGETVRIGPEYMGPFSSFRSLWISINGLESWDANPWVWAIEFEVLSITGKPENL